MDYPIPTSKCILELALQSGITANNQVLFENGWNGTNFESAEFQRSAKTHFHLCFLFRGEAHF